MHDLMVVGGGPAGLAVALNATGAGLRVLVSEKRAGAIDKACGEGLMPGALNALRALGIDPPGRDFQGITYRQGSTVTHADFRIGPGRGVRRTVLHGLMRDAAERLGVDFRQAGVEHVEQSADCVRADGIATRYLVAADGLHSGLRRRLGLEVTTASAPRWGQRRHYTGALSPRSVEVHWAAASEAYVTPVDERTVGVAILSSRPGSFDDQLLAFDELRRQLEGSIAISAVRGAGPLRQTARRRVCGRVMLVGDAAGYIDALTGEGLAVSFASAAALTACLIAGDPASYEPAYRRLSRRSRLITSALLWTRSQPRLSNRIVPFAAGHPRLFAAAIDQLAR